MKPAALIPRPRVSASGCLLCVCVAACAIVVEMVEHDLIGYRIVDALVISLLFGIALRTIYSPSGDVVLGVDFVATRVMNFAVVLLGLTVNSRRLFGDQVSLVLFAAAAVVAGFLASSVIARSLRLPARTSTLIATGASICGNSAIAAAAPAIRATKGEVAAAISISALLGIGQVLLFPIVRSAGGLDDQAYGFLAGISIYSVPQAIAASFAVNQAAGEVATTTKLARVLMLGPVVVTLGLLAKRPSGVRGVRGQLASLSVVPNFVLGFVCLAGVSAVFELPEWLVSGARTMAITLFTMGMAAVGLGVHAPELLRGAPRAGLAVLLSTGVMVGIGFVGIGLLHP